MTFGVSGKLALNALIMFDRQSESLWSQFLGEAIEGPHKGTKLELVASQLTTWGSWKEEHPETLALDIRAPRLDQYTDYYLSPSAGVLGRANPDDRLHGKELVVGIAGASTQRVYAHSDLADVGALNDSFDGTEIVIAMDSVSGAAGVFERNVDGRALSFVGGSDPGEMTDVETGTTWSKLTGKAIQGALKGSTLASFEYLNAFWFGWSDYYPNTELYEPS